MLGHMSPLAAGAAVVASSDFTTWVVVVAVLTGLAILAGLRGWRKSWIVRDTPTSKCAAVFVGRNEVVGKAMPCHPFNSPITGQPCVWFEWKIEQYHSDKDGGHWSTEEKRSTAAPFWIVDETGGVLVRPRGAEIDAVETYQSRLKSSGLALSWWDLRQATMWGEDQQERAISSRDAKLLQPPTEGSWWRKSTAAPLGSFGSDWRLTERAIAVGQPLYLLGDAQLRQDAAALEFCRGDDKLYLTHKNEAQVARSATTAAVLGLLAGLVGLVALPPLIKGDLRSAVGWMIAVGAVYVGLLGLVWLVRVRNRLVTVKEQAATAWSMIDIALRRRHDLVPQLVEVTWQYAAHEQEVQQATAELRAGTGLGTQERLPTDQSVHQATQVNEVDRDGTRRMLAVAEAYPDLKANTVFGDLQQRITRAEDQVAYARAFYNDAVTVLRDRRSTMPGILFAWSVTIPSWQLFAAADDDRRPVTLTRPPSAGPAPAPVSSAPAPQPPPPPVPGSSAPAPAPPAPASAAAPAAQEPPPPPPPPPPVLSP